MFGKKGKEYYFLIDNLTADKSHPIKRSLLGLDCVVDVKVNVTKSIIMVQSKRKIEDNVRLACQANGCTLRTEVRKGTF